LLEISLQFLRFIVIIEWSHNRNNYNVKGEIIYNVKGEIIYNVTDNHRERK